MNSESWCLANSGSIEAKVTAWNARSQSANQGYSQLSGMVITSWTSRCVQWQFRPVRRESGGGGWVGSPSSQRFTL
ncbi:MAG: hypothetical protein VYB77_00460 [Planctomycetota bacterium]|nr:hypothetical protein [Planctomycetota bacterium]